jgi:hypothetical protein
MVTPQEIMGSEIWIHISFVVFNVLDFLRTIREEGFSTSTYEHSFLGIQQQKEVKKTKRMAITFEEETKNNEEDPEGSYPSIKTSLTKEFWFKRHKDLDMPLIANIMGFAFQVKKITLFINLF